MKVFFSLTLGSTLKRREKQNFPQILGKSSLINDYLFMINQSIVSTFNGMLYSFPFLYPVHSK